MQSNENGRLVILSGPSCVGKSPLTKALQKFYPEIWKNLKTLVLYNSRAPRPGELDGVDYYFRTREYIKNVEEDENFVVMDVRGDLQALDLNELSLSLGKGNVLFEGNPFVGHTLLTHTSLTNIEKLDLFMSPLSKDEVKFLKEPEKGISLYETVTDVMRRKLLRRTKKQKNILSLKDLENIEKRASSAFKELKIAPSFSYVIPNHDGEDSENWDAFYYPLSDARKSLLAFVTLYDGGISENVENWSDIKL